MCVCVCVCVCACACACACVCVCVCVCKRVFVYTCLSPQSLPPLLSFPLKPLPPPPVPSHRLSLPRSLSISLSPMIRPLCLHRPPVNEIHSHVAGTLSTQQNKQNHHRPLSLFLGLFLPRIRTDSLLQPSVPLYLSLSRSLTFSSSLPLPLPLFLSLPLFLAQPTQFLPEANEFFLLFRPAKLFQRMNKPREPAGGPQPPGRVPTDEQAAGARRGAPAPWQGPDG